MNEKAVLNFDKSYKLPEQFIPVSYRYKKGSSSFNPSLIVYKNEITGQEAKDFKTLISKNEQFVLYFDLGVKKGLRFLTEYIPDADMCLIDCIEITFQTGTIESERRIYIGKDRIPYKVNPETGHLEETVFDLNIYEADTSYSYYPAYTNHPGLCGKTWEELTKPLAKVFPKIAYFKTNDITYPLKDGYMFLQYIQMPKKNIKTGKKQEEVNRLVKLHLKPADQIRFPAWHKYEAGRYARIDACPEADEKTCVLRTFFIYQGVIVEGLRIYVTQNNYTVARPTENGGWIPVSQKLSQKHLDFKLMSVDEEAVKGTMLEYFQTITSKIPVEKHPVVLFNFLQYPIAEQLAKTGLENVMINMMLYCNDNSKIDKKINTIFGQTDKNASSLYNALGLNAYQYSQFCKYTDKKLPKTAYGSRILAPVIAWTKYTACNTLTHDTPNEVINSISNNEFIDISSLDNETFDGLLNGFGKLIREEIKHHLTYFSESQTRICIPSYSLTKKMADCLTLISIMYGCKTAVSMMPVLSSIFELPQTRIADNIYLYCDYMNMIYRISSGRGFRPEFDIHEDDRCIEKLHQLATELYEDVYNEQLKSDFQHNVISTEKWTYHNDNFIVVAPSEPADLIAEGKHLHHCVKSYIEMVAEGKTNIMFIRKAEEPETPFFTVEISNKGYIEQIHGLMNRNANTEEGLIDFIDEWCKKANLKQHQYNKVR